MPLWNGAYPGDGSCAIPAVQAFFKKKKHANYAKTLKKSTFKKQKLKDRFTAPNGVYK